MLTNSDLQTINIGKQISQTINGGDILLLSGDLGAGKTTLAKGIAEGLGISSDIKSPTFTLMNVYNVKAKKQEIIKTFVHIDTYRLKDEQELVDIGIEDYLGKSDCVCVIEWPEKISGLLNEKKTKKITIDHTGEKERNITIQ